MPGRLGGVPFRRLRRALERRGEDAPTLRVVVLADLGGRATRVAKTRILLRLPYGKRTDPVEALDFEEIPPGREHAAYLWGNPAFACARLIASSFVENGVAMEPGDHLELDDLPAAVYDDKDGPKMKPCAETAFSEPAAQRILDAGVMPLLASSRCNAVRVMRFQSIAYPPRPLAGGWGQPSPVSDR